MGEVIVSWKVPKYKATAQEAYDEISTLEEITPKNVVDLARNVNSKIHDDFEWDNEIAGEKWRIKQAREMIQLLVFEDKEKEELQEPVRVLQISTKTSVYQPVKMIVQQQDEYQTLLKRAKAELEAFKRRYQSIVELESIFEAIDNL